MRTPFDIRVQKLFAIVLLLKVASSALAWALRMPWSLGFAVPLTLMLFYIGVGLGRRRDDVSDEKFADSCYYLGFIFTITSITFSLFDLPSIGTQLESIAVRFGAAMVSTVLGLGVRVYLVSFEHDATDAYRDAEEAVIDASRRFTQQLGLSLERLRDFEAEVDLAAKVSVERVNLQLEAIARTQAEQMNDFFADLAARNREAVASAFLDLQAASERLAETVDDYAGAMRANLDGIDAMKSWLRSRTLQQAPRGPRCSNAWTTSAKYLASPLAAAARRLRGRRRACARRHSRGRHGVASMTWCRPRALQRIAPIAWKAPSTSSPATCSSRSRRCRARNGTWRCSPRSRALLAGIDVVLDPRGCRRGSQRRRHRRTGAARQRRAPRRGRDARAQRSRPPPSSGPSSMRSSRSSRCCIANSARRPRSPRRRRPATGAPAPDGTAHDPAPQ